MEIFLEEFDFAHDDDAQLRAKLELHVSYVFGVPIGDSFIDDIDVNRLKQMLSMLEQSKQRDD